MEDIDMDVIQTKGETKNSSVLFLILGVLLVPTINAIEGIFFESSKLLPTIFPIGTLAIFSVIFHGLILLAVIILLFKILQKSEKPILTFHLKTFKSQE
jgi:hypothetical protein